jgi:hypothetical protein
MPAAAGYLCPGTRDPDSVRGPRSAVLRSCHASQCCRRRLPALAFAKYRHDLILHQAQFTTDLARRLGLDRRCASRLLASSWLFRPLRAGAVSPDACDPLRGCADPAEADDRFERDGRERPGASGLLRGLANPRRLLILCHLALRAEFGLARSSNCSSCGSRLLCSSLSGFARARWSIPGGWARWFTIGSRAMTRAK